MESKDKSDKKPCHFDIIKLTDKNGLGLKGVSKYDQAFLEELEIHKLKNTDLALKTIADFCNERKLPFKVMLTGKNLTDQKIIYEKK
jgi:hypothetical protein